MFMLQEDLLGSVTIEGEEFKLDMTFDNILHLDRLIRDKELKEYERVDTALYLLIGTSLEDMDYVDKTTVLNGLIEKIFRQRTKKEPLRDILGYVLPSELEEDKGEDSVDYCLYEDASYIYASFRQCYGIDLLEERGKMHWDVFNALLTGLSKDTKFMEVLEIRGKELPTGKGTQKEREMIQRQKNKYKLRNLYKA